jgi:hypothetical protein
LSCKIDWRAVLRGERAWGGLAKARIFGASKKILRDLVANPRAAVILQIYP